MNRKNVGLVALIVVLLAGATLGAIKLIDSAGTPSTPTVSATFRSGHYDNGPSDQPHYVVALTASANDVLSGTIDFVYQDGRSAVTLTFQGPSQDNLATVNVHSSASTSAAKNAPRFMSISTTPRKIKIGSCTNFLHFAKTTRACTFTYVSKT